MTGKCDGVKFLVSKPCFHSYQSWGSAEVAFSKFSFLVYKMEVSRSEKARWLKVLAAKPTNLSLISRIHMMEGDDILFLFFFSLCVFVCPCVCTCACVGTPAMYAYMHALMRTGCMCLCTWRPKDDVGRLTWLLFHLIYHGRISPSKRELTSTASRSSQLTPVLPSLLSLVLITDGPPCTPSICADFVTLNSGPLDWVTNTIMAEPSSQAPS